MSAVPAPAPSDAVAVAAHAGETIANLKAQGVNNLLMFVLAALIGLLIFLDRADRREASALQMRSFESQGELNRQAIGLVGDRTERSASLQAKAINELSMEVGKLQVTVQSLQQELRKKFP